MAKKEEVSVTDLITELAGLKKLVERLSKEVETLKKVKPVVSGGKDERVDLIIEVLKSHKIFKKRVENKNL